MLNNQKDKLILIEDLGMILPKATSKKKFRYGVYKCYCGNIFNARIQSVKSNNTKSCGCLHTQIATTHGLHKHRLYGIWSAMNRRTSSQNSKDYKYYGARGIIVCSRWLDIKNFIEDMYPTFEEGLSIDRINNDLGYSKDNCRWAPATIQSRNTSKIHSNNTSGYRGVFHIKENNNWKAQVRVNGRLVHLGYFKKALDAAIAYDEYVIDNNLEHTTNNTLKENNENLPHQ